MNEILSRLRKGIQKALSSPDSLVWSFDGQDRGGEPFRVFLDLNYHGKEVVVEWRSLWGDRFGVTLLDPDPMARPYGSGHDFEATGIEQAVAKVLSLLEPSQE